MMRHDRRRPHRFSAFFLAILFILVFANRAVFAQPPENEVFWGLDLEFGTDGVVTFFPPDHHVFYYHALFMSILPDGDILSVMGYTYLPPTDTAEAYTFVRFSPDGQVIDQVTSDGYLAGAVGVQSGGKFILREVDNRGPVPSIYLTRYASDFTRDMTFGEHGEVLVPAETLYTIVQADDKILGATYEGGYLFRFNSDGSVDKKFSKSIGPFPWIESIGGHPNGNVVVLWSDFDRCVAQIFASDGDLVETVFNTPGWDPGNHCNARDFSPTLEGGFVWRDGDRVYKTQPDGTPDLTFGEQGSVQVDLPDGFDFYPEDLLMEFDVDAPIYLVGGLTVGDQHRILVAAFDQEGAPGRFLSPYGYLTIPAPPAPYTSRQVIQMEDGKLLLNGHNIETGLGEGYKLFQITSYPLTARSYFPVIGKAP